MRQEHQAQKMAEVGGTESLTKKTENPTMSTEALELEALLEQLHRQERSARRHLQVMGGGSVLAVALMVLVESWGVYVALHKGIESLPFWAVLFSWALFLLVVGGSAGVYYRDMRRGLKLLKQLSAYSDVRVIGPLLSLLSISPPGTREAIADALIGLLPQMEPKDAAHLTQAQRAQLHAILLETHRSYQPLQLAVIQALWKIGDAEAIPFVARLAESPLRRQRVVKEAAQNCLPQLQHRAEQMRLSKTLLRASPKSLRPSELLRPMGSRESVEGEQHQLVRPILGEGGEAKIE